MKTKDLFEFGYRTNVNTYNFNGKRVFIYNDHRTLLNVIFYALKNGFIKEVPNVFFFDYHDDALNPRKAVLEKAIDFDLSETSEEAFNSMVEYDMSHMDDDWVKTGMEFGLIKNSVSIGTVQYNSSYELYKDCKGEVHDLICISHLKFALSERGELGDSQLKEPSFKIVRELFNYNNGKLSGFGDSIAPFILDFDLDCFSDDFRGTTMAWPETMFKDEMYSQTGYYNEISAHKFISDLINRCEFITICMEPDCCGGIGESFKILSYLDKYFFEGIFKTKPTI